MSLVDFRFQKALDDLTQQVLGCFIQEGVPKLISAGSNHCTSNNHMQGGLNGGCPEHPLT